MAGSRVALMFVGCLLCATPAIGQSWESHWGVQASFAPNWESRDFLKPLFDADRMYVSGDELRIGLARGRTLGGDWGIVYVRKTVEDGSFAVKDGEFERTTRGVVVSGVSVEKFAPFGTIKERLQIGLVFGIGVGTAKGEAVERDVPTGTVETVEASRFFSPMGTDIAVVPLAKLELAAAIIAAPGFKIRGSAGFNYPGISTFTIAGVFLFGAR